MKTSISHSSKRKKTVIAIVGPTAVGKTAMAISLAKHFNTAILSADSRQFYREMSIGTAKPDASELAQAPHYFIDSHSIEDDYSAGDFERDALKLLEELFRKHDVVLLVGGSGLFVRALAEGLDNLPKGGAGIREGLNAQLAAGGLAGLKERLKEVDPSYYQQADVDNPQRVIRALEVYETTGNPISHYLQHAAATRPFAWITIGLQMDREALYQRINARVDKMVGAGLVDEVRSLQKYRDKPALLTVGYAEIFDYLDGKLPLDEAVSAIKQNSRRYAKRQITWFKKYGNTSWFEPNQVTEIINYLEQQL